MAVHADRQVDIGLLLFEVPHARAPGSVVGLASDVLWQQGAILVEAVLAVGHGEAVSVLGLKGAVIRGLSFNRGVPMGCEGGQGVGGEEVDGL